MKNTAWMSFPYVPLAKERLCFAGTLMYTPQSELNQQIIQMLQILLTRSERLVGDEIIARIEVDWDLLHENKGDMTLRSHVFLWSAGTENASTSEHWQNVALLFYRQDPRIVDGPSPRPIAHRIHIPDQSGQDILLSACRDVLNELRAGKTDAFEAITDYLTANLDYDLAWTAIVPDWSRDESAQLVYRCQIEVSTKMNPAPLFVSDGPAALSASTKDTGSPFFMPIMKGYESCFLPMLNNLPPFMVR